jgi:hypothetical protein
VKVHAENSYLYRVERGKIASVRLFAGRDEALAAAKSG